MGSIDSLLKKLKESKEFKKYKEKNPSAYLCVGFFVLDFQSGHDSYQFDYCFNNQIETFFIEPETNEIKSKPAEPQEGKMPGKISENVKIDLKKIREIAENYAEKNDLKLTKIIAILQIHEGRQIWNLTCISGFKMLRLYIDSESGEILKTDTASMFDFIKKT